MTREQAIEKLKETHGEDRELAHIEADQVLCDLLIALGFADVVAEWGKDPKWYA